ncbi:unnamed protein product [Acanthosepion pharaonis]|uniref:Uncharacterized protein n=1 Tax=Acanthosepion pharaonis TaxID=158019 RepID=A0A812DHN5_ACAPH|nr:unnamed protein product [Sepia pharaonis]
MGLAAVGEATGQPRLARDFGDPGAAAGSRRTGPGAAFRRARSASSPAVSAASGVAHHGGGAAPHRRHAVAEQYRVQRGKAILHRVDRRSPTTSHSALLAVVGHQCADIDILGSIARTAQFDPGMDRRDPPPRPGRDHRARCSAAGRGRSPPPVPPRRSAAGCRTERPRCHMQDICGVEPPDDRFARAHRLLRGGAGQPNLIGCDRAADASRPLPGPHSRPSVSGRVAGAGSSCRAWASAIASARSRMRAQGHGKGMP